MDSSKRLALLAICVGFAVIQLDATIVTVAVPAMRHDVGGTLAAAQWIIDGYALALAGLMVGTGPLGDRYGARRCYLAGLVIFTVASAACALAVNLPLLIAARVAQGIGAAALLPSSLALLAYIFPAGRERAHALGVWGGVASIGLAAGPVLGGLLVATAGWRMIFLVNVPIGVLAAALVVRTVPETPRRTTGRLDVTGIVAGVGALATACAACIWAGEHGWIQPLTSLLIVAAAVSGVVFWRVERRTAAPAVPLSIFAGGPYRDTVAMGYLFNLCLYGSLLCLSLYLQQTRGLPSAMAGAALLPLTIAIGLGATACGPLMARYGPRPLMLAGMSCAATGALLLAVSGPETPVAIVLAGTVLLGGCSLAMPAMTSVALAALRPNQSGLASGVLNAARQAGGALGVALLGALTGREPSLHLPLAVVAIAYALAAFLAWRATDHQRRRRPVVSSG